MGNDQSKKGKVQEKSTKPSGGKSTSLSYKRVLLLHKSGQPNQVKTVRNFRDALVQEANGEVKVAKTINLEDENAVKNVLSLSWLDELNNVVVICLSEEIINSLGGVLRDKRLADENGHLHAKIVAVSFGKKAPAGWPPQGFSRPTVDKKDFCFGFDDGVVVSPKEFEGAKLNALIATIMSME